MCVSTSPAELGGTRAYTWHTLGHPNSQRPSWHVTAYQNFARNLSPDPNCMLLHFPGSHLSLVRGPELTRQLMADVTWRLPELLPTPKFMGSRGISELRVEDYGDYTVVLAQYPSDILAALEQVPAHRRPKRTSKLEELVDWYRVNYPDYVFALACFAEGATPRHPIVVEYVPDSDDLLFIPGLDCHTGEIPQVGQMMQRDFRVAFGSELHPQKEQITYSDDQARGAYWAPNSVVGFYDNDQGPNKDYIVPLVSIEEGLTGRELLDVLVS